MKEALSYLTSWITDPTLGLIARVVVLLLVIMPLFFLLGRIVRRAVERRYTQQSGMLLGKAIGYAGFVLVGIAVLKEFGFELGALLGAAGIAAAAIGFASQTSLSNIISGIFLISEKPFAVGELIRVGDEVGFVLSIDLMSVKVRAFDNRLIRIPNENLVKSQLVNLTRFPIRRVDIKVGVAYKEDPDRVMDILKDIALHEPLVLDEPEPLIVFQSFGDSALDFLFGVWCVRTDYRTVKNTIMSKIKTRFDDEGIEIPFPHRTLYTGSQTDPMPIRIVSGEELLTPADKDS
jgi:small-conductance mechanosensitive channel